MELERHLNLHGIYNGTSLLWLYYPVFDSIESCVLHWKQGWIII